MESILLHPLLSHKTTSVPRQKDSQKVGLGIELRFPERGHCGLTALQVALPACIYSVLYDNVTQLGVLREG